MNNNQLINLLTVILGIMISILVILCIIFIVVKIKNKQPKQKNKNTAVNSKNRLEGNRKKATIPQTYNKESVFNFMEFDSISDNMIVQKDGKRFLMVIECQGINFDLMSGLEKNSVEQGFLQFLNTLRYPIQIYVQTRTVNLGSSISTYKDRVDTIAKQYRDKQAEYNQKVRSGQYTEQQLDKDKYELTRQRNLYEYGLDIVNNTERMSLNKNILSKHYYIIIPHYSEESNDTHYVREEISNMAFSELYTKAQSIISSLSVCNINSKILDSTELAELLYVAYNRDESEIFNLQRALNAGYEDLYSTAPNVLDKRMQELDIKIEEDAIKRANDAVYEVLEENEKQREVREKEEKIEELIDEMAKALIENNKDLLGNDVAEKSIKKVSNRGRKKKNEEENLTEEKKGGEEDGKKSVNKRRRVTKSV